MLRAGGIGWRRLCFSLAGETVTRRLGLRCVAVACGDGLGEARPGVPLTGHFLERCRIGWKKKVSKSGAVIYVNTVDRTSSTVRPKFEAVATPAAADAATGEKCCGAARAMDATSDERVALSGVEEDPCLSD